MRKRKLLKRSGASAGPQISDAEWIVMKVFWEKRAATANQVVEALQSQIDWKPKTIHTLISRLVQKGALNYEKEGREYLFRPVVEADKCLHEASRSFLSRFFDGEVAPFLACFLEQERMTKEEIDELKRILDSKRK